MTRVFQFRVLFQQNNLYEFSVEVPYNNPREVGAGQELQGQEGHGDRAHARLDSRDERQRGGGRRRELRYNQYLLNILHETVSLQESLHVHWDGITAF